MAEVLVVGAGPVGADVVARTHRASEGYGRALPGAELLEDRAGRSPRLAGTGR
jgi:hypothetical protein